MTPNYYAGDVTRLSDEELAALRQEIEDSGALSEDYDCYHDEDKPLRNRYRQLGDEQKRRKWERDPEAYQAHLRREAKMAPIIAMIRRDALKILSRYMVFSKVAAEPMPKDGAALRWFRYTK